MLRLTYLYRNLTRNRLRTGLTLAAVALPIMIYVLSMAVVDGVERFLENSAKQLRLAVTQKASIVNPLPAGHRPKIEALDPTRTRLISVCGLRWIGGKIERDPRPLSTLGVDHDTFAATFPDYRLTPEELDVWARDRRALIAGRATARQFGWKVGDRVTIHPSVPPYIPMEFNIISTAEDAEDPITLICRLDYIEERLKEEGWAQGLVNFFFVKCATKADVDYYTVAIDELFAGSTHETKTQDEKAFMNEFITQQFDLPRNLTILAGVTVFVAVMAAANTMSMNFRDRTSEIATLKSMGFSSRFVFTQIQAESLLLCTIGGLIGALGPYIAFMHTRLGNLTVPLIQHLEISPTVVLEALAISVLIGIIAAVWPSWLAMRMKVVTALRSLE
ncbi:MAG TPA: ABC transporter permease [Phycisphaerae bacterium]|jgi:putative ABC transport system permease protein|nr:ABC transporter permease [Phycisphaerae bacterium]HOB75485.1 ABC transporter permease [Phycisphaerae bacterium]HOJ55291.1 ABC transporter permease [Phycisphaerae bacterium]HOL27421.1 ABC transporter permease [Phycisphaerae bacterium]HPP21594.1 ABC transporter permease [Phycisphaerae bacterium]